MVTLISNAKWETSEDRGGRPVQYGRMYGISARSGRKLGGIDQLRQSTRDILTTPIGSRVMRRDYGSRLFDIIDAPYSSATKLAIIAATA